MDKKEDFFNGFDDDILDDDFVDDEEEDEESDESEDTGSDDTGKEADEKEDSPSDEKKADDVKSEEKDSDEAAKEAEKKAKEAEKNAKFAEQRRKAEAEAKAKKDREAEERIRKDATLKAELGAYKVNTYTNEPIIDETDLNIFKVQKQLDEEGKDPIQDLPKRMAELEREAIAKEKAKEEERRKEQEKYNEQAKAEVSELREAYPELDVAKLRNDPLWVEAFEKDGGRLTLKEIYEFKYLPKMSAGKKAEVKTDDTNSKKLTKTPSSQSNGGNSNKSYLEMSDEEYLAAEKKERNDDFF